jgi:hypothetical protein
MASRFEQEVRRSLSRYLAEELSLRSLQEWLVPQAWDLDPAEDPSAYQLVSHLELILAEASAGHWTEAEIRDKFGPYAKIVEMVQAPGVQYVTTSVIGKQPLHSTIQIIRNLPMFPLSVTGGKLVVA